MKLRTFFALALSICCIIAIPNVSASAALPVVDASSYTWIMDGDNWRISNGYSNVASSWILYNDDIYYLDSLGNMKSDCWQKYKNAWYYLDKDGKLVRDAWIFSTYYADSSGKITKQK